MRAQWSLVTDSDPVVSFGRDVCGDLAQASTREWLVTSGNGAFASGTIDGAATRKYHGLLFAAPSGPADRILLCVKFDETATYGDARVPLATNRWHDGTIAPEGYRAIERFFLDGTTPVWHFALADALLEKRITMEPDENATVVRYELLRGSRSVMLELKAIVDHRDCHGNTHAGDRLRYSIDNPDGTVRVRLDADLSVSLRLRATSGVQTVVDEWYRDYDLPAERERGLDDREDHLCAATFTCELGVGEVYAIRAGIDSMPEFGSVVAAFPRRVARDAAHLRYWHEAHPALAARAPAAIVQLVYAAEQFVVGRPLATLSEGHSIVAGYPWFGDWGRDAMISLPGVLLATGRHDVAFTVLRTFGRLIDGGMLPNTIPDRGAPSYNTVDAALWFVDAVRAYVAASGNVAALDEFFPMMQSIVDAYTEGTRYGIRVDPADDLVTAGEAGVQLTWMDAIVDGRVITPRMGKPVEINALWYNALRVLASLAPRVGLDAAPYEERANGVAASFTRFRGGADGGLLDVIDGPAGDDRSLRPNQIFAASLTYRPIDDAACRAVVDVCARHLLTSYGLRSLAPSDARYIGTYVGNAAARDAAYHQGTVWGWLIGPFVSAHAHAYGDRARALAYVEPLLDHLGVYGLGTLGEIFDGDAPFLPRGAPAQAWTVGEVLRVWHELA